MTWRLPRHHGLQRCTIASLGTHGGGHGHAQSMRAEVGIGKEEKEEEEGGVFNSGSSLVAPQFSSSSPHGVMVQRRCQGEKRKDDSSMDMLLMPKLMSTTANVSASFCMKKSFALLFYKSTMMPFTTTTMMTLIQTPSLPPCIKKATTSHEQV